MNDIEELTEWVVYDLEALYGAEGGDFKEPLKDTQPTPTELRAYNL